MRGRRQWQHAAVLLILGLILAGVQVWVRLQVIAVGYTISDTRQLLQTLEGQRQVLEGEWEKKIAPAVLAEQATQRLGLGTPLPGQVVRVR